MIRSLTSVLTILFLSTVCNIVNAQGLVSHDFDDGDMGPFVHCTTQNPNYAKVVNNRLRTYWEQSSYNPSSRMTKGAEACADPSVNGIGYLTWKYCWMGFTINIDEGYMPNGMGIGSLAQIFGFNDARGQFSWTALLEMKDGDLFWIDRRGIGNTREDIVIYEDFPKGVDMDIIVHAVLSDNSTGLVEIWINEELVYSAYNIRIGMGDFDENDYQTNQSYTEFKIGMYNHSSAETGEIRIVDYDNLSWYDGVDGYDIVNPDKDGTACIKTTALTEAECYDDSLGIQVVDGSVIGYVENGDWTSYNGLDLTDMNSVEMIYASQTSGGTIEIRLDALDGEVIGEMELAGTGGWDTWETENVNIERVDGSHDLYLVFIGGDGYLFDVDKFGFSEEVICDQTSQKIEAECYDDMEEIQTEGCSEGTKNVGWIQDGDWTMYSNVDLTNMQSIKARVSGNTTGSIIEVRIDGEEGEIIGEIPVTNTGGNQNWVTDSVNIESTNGIHDVYLKFSGGDGYLFNINHFGFSEESIVVTGLNYIEITEIEVYPNPAKDKLVINRVENGTYELYGNSGSIHMEGSIESKKEVINIHELSNGIYFLKVIYEGSTETIKVIKR